MAEFAADVTDLGDKIAALTIVKAVELKNYLKEKYSIDVCLPQMVELYESVRRKKD